MIQYISCLEPKKMIFKEKSLPKKQEGKTLLKVKKLAFVVLIYMHTKAINHFLNIPAFLGMNWQ